MNQRADIPAYVIFTRFNLPSKGYESYVRSSENWLTNRVKLFERYCLPSVMAQTDQDFTWIIYFDPQSPEWLMRKIEGWRSYSRLRPIFREEVSFEEKHQDIAANVLPRPRLISTNLDNDDGLAHDFVARIKAVQPVGPRCAIFLANGIILSEDRTFLIRDRQNAFCSVSEGWHQPVTCWAHPHNALSQHMPFVSVDDQPAWLQVVHGGNVSNRVKGRRISPGRHRPNFVALETATDPTLKEQLQEVLVHTPTRTARELARATAKHAILGTLGPDGIDRAKNIWRRQKILRFFQ
jgi:hypothetical protein